MNTLGIDLGGVVIHRAVGTPENIFFSDRCVEVPPNEGAFAAIKYLFALFSGRVHVVSKASGRTEARCRRWLEHHRFSELTGVTSITFVPKRPDKGPVCTSLGITHFIDDREDVLDHLNGIVPFQFLFGRTGVVGAGRWGVPDWAVALEVIYSNGFRSNGFRT